MARGKRYYWMKLKADFMASDEADFLMSREDGARLLVFYQMLCLKTINTDGYLTVKMGEMDMPLTADKLSRDLKWFSKGFIEEGLALFCRIGLLATDSDGTYIVHHADLVGSETDWAVKRRAQRGQRGDNVPIEKESEIRDQSSEKESEKESEKAPDETAGRQKDILEVYRLYQSLCPSYPEVTLSEARGRLITRRLSDSGLAMIEEAFRAAEASSFLKGGGRRGFKADFDWMLNKEHLRKLSLHAYDDRAAPESALEVLSAMASPSNANRGV